MFTGLNGKTSAAHPFPCHPCLWKAKNVKELPLFVFPKLHRDIYGIWPNELAFLGKFYTNGFLLFEQLVTYSGFKVIYLERNTPI